MKTKIAVLLGVLGLTPLEARELPSAIAAHAVALDVRTGALMDRIAGEIDRAAKAGKYEVTISYRGFRESTAMEVMEIIGRKGYFVDGYFPKTLWIKWN